MAIMRPTDILLPRRTELKAWSVVACDQFTSQPEYWDEAAQAAGEEPSTLHLTLPEAWLDTPRAEGAQQRIASRMEEYLAADVFAVLPESFVYVERIQSDGRLRRGLVGALDLECYDFAPGSCSPVRATEDTVARRLPPRVKVRQEAALELPHVIVLMDDRDDMVLGPLGTQKPELPALYDFELMLGGGHLSGWQVSGATAERTAAALERLEDGELLRKKYGDGRAPVVFAMGDGNHSLATAKLCWEEWKKKLSPAQQLTHPARWSLVELVNIHDQAISFAPIHRLLRGTDTAAFLREARARFGAERGGEEHALRCLCAGEELWLHPEGTIGQVIGRCEDFCLDYLRRHGGEIDYIHGDSEAETLGRQPGCCALILPAMEKSELFTSVMESGPFPRKSFSIGQARDKRYYLEARRIR